jgi:hypothetical protein
MFPFHLGNLRFCMIGDMRAALGGLTATAYLMDGMGRTLARQEVSLAYDDESIALLKSLSEKLVAKVAEDMGATTATTEPDPQGTPQGSLGTPPEGAVIGPSLTSLLREDPEDGGPVVGRL